MSKQRVHAGGFRSRILTLGIAIVFVMFIGYAISTIYPEPSQEDFCGPISERVIIDSEAACLESGGSWRPTQFNGGKLPSPDDPEFGVEGYCTNYYSCDGEFQDARSEYNRNIFFISLAIGLLVIVGAIFLAVESVSAGFMGGGILLIFYGTLRYWGDLSDIWRTIMLGFALAVLVFIGYKKLR